jgi:PAS domain S-box-containing protein
MLGFVRQHLLVKFLGLTLVAALPLCAMVLAAYYPYRQEALINEMTAVIGVTAAKLDSTIAQDVTNGDRGSARQMLSTFGAFTYTVCAEYYIDASKPPSAFWPIPCSRMKKPGETVTVPSAASDRDGYFLIRLSGEEVNRILEEEFIVLAALGLATTIALLAMVGVVFHLLINTPLHRLLTAIRRFETSNLPEKVEWGAPDEIGRVVRRYNAMLDSEVSRVREREEAHQKTRTLLEQLQISEARTRSIIENAADGVVVIDKHGIVELFSPAAEGIFGYRADEVVGRNVSMLMPQQVAQLHDGYIRRYMERLESEIFSVNREVEGVRKNGEHFPMDLAVGVIPLEGGYRFTGIIRDITERRRSAQALQDAYDVISNSINYASHIQQAMYQPLDEASRWFRDGFIWWEPRDVVSGDFYWLGRWGNGILVLAGDCTGHGVPGAFMTIITNCALHQSLSVTEAGDVAGLLGGIHQRVRSTLGQDTLQGRSDDGLEAGACYIDADRSRLVYAGARWPLFLLQGGEPRQIAGTRSGMGYRRVPQDQAFEAREMTLLPDTRLYMTSDGMLDQVGGAKGRMFGKRRFQNLLLEVEQEPMERQKQLLQRRLAEYQGKRKRRDDIVVVGCAV